MRVLGAARWAFAGVAIFMRHGLLVQAKETLEDAARNVRALIDAQSIGTLASVYPSSSSVNSPVSPLNGPNLAGHAFALPEYYAPCFPQNGSLLLILFRISQNAKNILAEPPSSDSLFEPEELFSDIPYDEAENDAGPDSPAQRSPKTQWRTSGRATFVVQELPLAHSPVARPRVSLMGNVTIVSDQWFTSLHADEQDALESCYVGRHPDAKWWIPGKGAFHDVAWARFDPEAVYYVGGFGGEHYIGHIPLDLYQSSGALRDDDDNLKVPVSVLRVQTT